MISCSRRLGRHQLSRPLPCLVSFPPELQVILRSDDPSSGSLFLGNIEAALDHSTLTSIQARTVLNAARQAEVMYPASVTAQHHLPIPEQPDSSIGAYLREGVEFIAEQLKHTNVLVHCVAGMSRSAAVVAAYLVHSQRISSQEAQKFIMQRRKMVTFSSQVAQALKQYEISAVNKRNSPSSIMDKSASKSQSRSRRRSMQSQSVSVRCSRKLSVDKIVQSVKSHNSSQRRNSADKVKHLRTPSKQKLATEAKSTASKQHHVHFDSKIHVKSENPQMFLGELKELDLSNQIKFKTYQDRRYDSQVSASQSQNSQRSDYRSIVSRKSRNPLVKGASRAEFDLKMNVLDKRNAQVNLRIQDLSIRFEDSWEEAKKWLEGQLLPLREEQRRIDECLGLEGGQLLSNPF